MMQDIVNVMHWNYLNEYVNFFLPALFLLLKIRI